MQRRAVGLFGYEPNTRQLPGVFAKEIPLLGILE